MSQIESLSQIEEKLNNLSLTAKNNIDNANTHEELDQLRVSLLGKKGDLSIILKTMGQLSATERPIVGQKANLIKINLQELITERKNQLNIESLDKKISSISIEILDVLLENDRVGELTLLMRSYQNIISEKSKSAKVSCTVAQPLGQEQIVELEQIIGSKLDKNIDMKINVDPNILGGMILRVDNSIIDGSVKTQLNKIRKNFTLK